MLMKQKTLSTIILIIFFFVSILFSSQIPVYSSEKSQGSTVYIPAYSHIYHGSKETPLLLSVTLSIRNIDRKHSLTVTAVNYHETQGALLKKYIVEPLVLGPLGTVRFIVPQKDNSGGSGANFIVDWQSELAINPPIIETVMIGNQSQLGISFTSRGVAIIE